MPTTPVTGLHSLMSYPEVTSAEEQAFYDTQSLCDKLVPEGKALAEKIGDDPARDRPDCYHGTLGELVLKARAAAKEIEVAGRTFAVVPLSELGTDALAAADLVYVAVGKDAVASVLGTLIDHDDRVSGHGRIDADSKAGGPVPNRQEQPAFTSTLDGEAPGQPARVPAAAGGGEGGAYVLGREIVQNPLIASGHSPH